MQKLFLILILSTHFHYLFGQSKGDYNWQLGFNSHPLSHPSPKSLSMTFDAGARNIDTFYRSMQMGYFNASICDSTGKLLLYSNGCKINDGNHKLIVNSDDLTPGPIDDDWCGGNPTGYPIFDGGIFLPFFNDSLILLLHQRQVIASNPLTVYVDALFYSKLIAQNDTYILEEKGIPFLQDSLSEGRLEAIQGLTADYWWVIQGIRNSNKYYTIGFESGDIDTIFIQTIGDTTVKQGEAAAQSVFSPDGSKYARYSPADDLFLFDFNRTNGLLSNYLKVHVSDSGIIGGLAFASNSKLLYASSLTDLYQFDVSKENIQASRTHIGHYDGFLDPFPVTFYLMQLGPDCKIYMIPPNGVSSMHVINDPDNEGMACNFAQHSLHFPISNTITLPNFPVFRSFSSQPCDPSLSTLINWADDTSDIAIYPNPARDHVTLEITGIDEMTGPLNFSIFSFTGFKLISSKLENLEDKVEINISDLPVGIYYAVLQINTSRQIQKIVKL